MFRRQVANGRKVLPKWWVFFFGGQYEFTRRQWLRMWNLPKNSTMGAEHYGYAIDRPLWQRLQLRGSKWISDRTGGM